MFHKVRVFKRLTRKEKKRKTMLSSHTQRIVICMPSGRMGASLGDSSLQAQGCGRLVLRLAAVTPLLCGTLLGGQRPDVGGVSYCECGFVLSAFLAASHRCAFSCDSRVHSCSPCLLSLSSSSPHWTCGLALPSPSLQSSLMQSHLLRFNAAKLPPHATPASELPGCPIW